jgi:hypothetical protein
LSDLFALLGAVSASAKVDAIAMEPSTHIESRMT